jgi:hypothetical protein
MSKASVASLSTGLLAADERDSDDLDEPFSHDDSDLADAELTFGKFLRRS